MMSLPETAERDLTTPSDPAQRPRRSRAASALVTAGLLIVIVGVLAYLIVLAQPFADASGGCGGG